MPEIDDKSVLKCVVGAMIFPIRVCVASEMIIAGNAAAAAKMQSKVSS